MTTEATPRLYSYDDYAAIDDDERYEVLEGELVPMGPAPRWDHQKVAGNLFTYLNLYAMETGAGTAFVAAVDVVLKAERPANVLQPDAGFVLRSHHDRITAPNLQGAPDLVVEVLSPSNARKDTVRKRRLYEQYGVPEFWIVPLSVDQIEVLRLGPDGRYGAAIVFKPGDTLTSPLLPGFALDVAKAFWNVP